MPVPLLVWGVLAGVAAVGAKKGIDGAVMIRDANERAQGAQGRHATASRDLEVRRGQVTERAQVYGEHLIRLQQTTLTEARELLRALEQRPKAKTLRVPNDVKVSTPTLAGFEHQVLDPPADAVAALGAVSAGAAAGSTTVGLVGLFATASTGTAIGSLSGAAATNATLAWLGGGPLALGGGGMAAGAITLGGVMVAPALLIGGFVIASKGEEALTEVRRYEARVSTAVSEIASVSSLLGQVIVRIEELEGLAGRIDERARRALSQIDVAAFDQDDDHDMARLTLALQLVQALSEVMQTPILTTDGKLSEASSTVQLRYRELPGDRQ